MSLVVHWGDSDATTAEDTDAAATGASPPGDAADDDGDDPEEPAAVGGKAATLLALARARLPVPPGFVVTTEAFLATTVPAGIPEAWEAYLARCDDPVGGPGRTDGPGLAALEASGRRLRALLAACPTPPEVADRVTAAYRRLSMGVPGGVLVAVRSSAIDEDRPDASRAGAYDTVLGVRGERAVLDAIRRCWAGLFGTRALAGLLPADRLAADAPDGRPGMPRMAVIVQRLVDPRVAGVAFTLDPSTGDRKLVAIEAAWGLGEAVAGGAMTPDGYLVEKDPRRVLSVRPARKAAEDRVDPDGVRRHTVPPDRRDVPCLDEADILAVAELALAAERHFARPQDVEWALEDTSEGARLWLLQSRPETAWAHRPPSEVRPLPPAGASSRARLRPTEPDSPLPRPLDCALSGEAAGWERLYPYGVLFDAADAEREDAAFWFHDGLHWPEVVLPWEATVLDAALGALSQYTNRVLLVPGARGVQYRLLNGRPYVSPVAVEDPAEIAARDGLFAARAAAVHATWEQRRERWHDAVVALIGDLERLSFAPLPDIESDDVVAGAPGSAYAQIRDYLRLLDLTVRLHQHHFELLTVGYAAYLDLFVFCRAAFPGIPDLTIAELVAGDASNVFRPHDELRSLARLAVDLGVDDAFCRRPDETPDVTAIEAELATDPRGRRWLAAWHSAATPWFQISPGSGFSHRDRTWAERREVPYAILRAQLTSVRTETDEPRSRDRARTGHEQMVADYTATLPDAERAAFVERLTLARRVFPYVEEHGFYVEHWAHSVIWRKMRDLGEVLRRAEFLPTADDVFLLRRDEVADALTDLHAAWAAGVPSRGRLRWPAEIDRRRRIITALERWSPPPALGTRPATVTEPFSVMLWGITAAGVSARVPRAGGHPEQGDHPGPTVLTGLPASSGVATGRARVVASARDAATVAPGEILVAPLTAPNWAVVFGLVRAVVTDVGGVMSHAAIVCREHGLPAVTATTEATRIIRTGQLVTVDGDNGQVILHPDPGGPR